MKSIEFLTEIERIHKYDFIGGKEFLKDPHHPHHSKNKKNNIKELPGGSGLKYTIDKRNIDDITIQMLDKNATDVIGSLSLNKDNHFPIKDSYRVNVITVDEDYRSQGIAKALYGIALTELKVTLLSGSSQTPGGRKNWLSLSNIPGVEIKGYVVLDEGELKTDRVIDKKLHDKFDIESINRRNKKAEERINILMSKLGGQYMGTAGKDEIYFAFDVVPGTIELKSAVKTKLSALYYSDYVMNYFTGLYAQWNDQ